MEWSTEKPGGGYFFGTGRYPGEQQGAPATPEKVRPYDILESCGVGMTEPEARAIEALRFWKRAETDDRFRNWLFSWQLLKEDVTDYQDAVLTYDDVERRWGAVHAEAVWGIVVAVSSLHLHLAKIAAETEG